MELIQSKPTEETRSPESPLLAQHPARLTMGTVLALSITICCWASSFVGIRAGLHGYSPTHLALLRYLTASLVLALVAGIKRMPLPRWRDVPGLALTGVVGIALYNVALNTGEASVSAGLSSFLVNINPIITAGLSILFLRERLRLWGWIGMLICILGASLISLSTGEGIHFSAGALFVLCAALAQSLYFLWQKPYLARYSALQCTTYAIWTGTLALLVFAPGLLANVRTASLSETTAVVYLGIFPAAIGYVSWGYALARIPASRAASFLYLVPAVTLVIAWFWLGEWPTWLALSGGVVAISGVMVVNIFGKRRERKDEESQHGEVPVQRENLARHVVHPQTERTCISMITSTNANSSPLTTGAVISADGTTIGYRQVGQGPALVMLHGANVSGQDFTQLAAGLADLFTVYLPDRRGRGLSGPFSANYSIQQEVEDLSALVQATGAQLLYGVSAGGLICLQTALSLPSIRKMALYEPALLVDGTKHTAWLARFDQEMAQGQTAAALVTSMKGLELGGPVMNAMPDWLLKALTEATMKSEDKKANPTSITMRKLAPTLHYDGLLLAQMSGQQERFRAVNAEVLLLSGGKGLPFLKPSLDTLESVLPHVAKRIEFPGLEHGGSNNPSQTNRGSKPELVAQELRQFFTRP